MSAIVTTSPSAQPAIKAGPAATRRERIAWYLYDFGNSSYAAVVLLAVYAAYFKQQVVGGAEGSRLWGLSVGIAMVVVAILSPILGAIADFSASKKRFLLFFTTMACLFTALLFFAQKGDVVIGMLFFILAEIGYRSAQVFYDALLPEIARPEEIGRVSGIGWAVGSAGGVVALLIILPLIMIFKGPLMIRLSLVITAIFYTVMSLPLFFMVHERGVPQPLPAGETYLTIGFRRLAKTFRAAKHFREFLRFMVAFLIYNDGIIMALDFAAIIGAVLFGLNQQMLIGFVILVQITSVGGASIFGLLADRWDCKRALIVSLLLMIAAIGWMYFERTTVGFFLIGALAGFALSGVQSVSRTMVGVFSPRGQSAEFYGFFSVVGRTSSFIGPTIYGLVAAGVAQRLERQGLAVLLAEQTGQRIAILSIGVFLVVGLVLLLFANEAKARAAAGQIPMPENNS
jgi:UMF1 family MFS transporter